MNGKFIVFSGTEGSGKKTCFTALKDIFRRDTSLLFVSEFSSNENAAVVRAFAGYSTLTSFEQFQMYIAARSIFVRETIVPAIESGVHIVCNKSCEMTWAKQVFAMDKQSEYGELFWQFLGRMMHGVAPDLYIDFRIDPKAALLRHHGLVDDEDDELDPEEVSRNYKIRDGIDDFFFRTKVNTKLY